MPNKPLTKKPEWAALKSHHKEFSKNSIASLFDEAPERFSNFSKSLDGLLFDYSKNLLTDETIKLLIALAESCDIELWRKKLFSGEPVNTSENRAALHTALRGSVDSDLEIDDENVSAFVSNSLARIESLSHKIRSDKKFTDIVNIGIGGSDLGPHMVYDALSPFADGPNIHFVSNVDGAHLSQTLADLTPDTTLFVIASKTFTTLETLTNAQSAQAWLDGRTTSEHFIAITGNEQAAQNFGIAPTHILPLREWVGGRYSLWSGIGLSIAIATGYNNFEQLLAGAHAMDRHFKSAPLQENLPVLMAMIGVWHRNICGYSALAILPYAQNLHRFPAYIQQLDMESNGKNTDRDGKTVTCQTSPVVFGEPGTDGQHAFFQLLHQGSMIIPCDFIITTTPQHDLKGHHTHLLANALAQSEALMRGNGPSENSYECFEGDRPSSSIVLQTLDPYHLGMLLALYEHKTFTQGVIWNINSFDQWGVDLGKVLAKNITEAFDIEGNTKNISISTKDLLQHILQCKK